MPAVPPSPVSSRLVVLFPGFEPLPVEAHVERFRRGLASSPRLYGHRFEPGRPTYRDIAPGLQACHFEVEADGPGRCRSSVIIYGLNAFNRVYAARWPGARLLSGLAGLLDFLISGTFFRYLTTSWRYGLFFLFPLALLAGVAAAGVGTFTLLGALDPLLAGVAAASLVLLLLWAADHWLHFMLLMDDWSFARDLARNRNPDIGELLSAVTSDVVEQTRRAEVDEVIFAAHSFGAVTALAACAAAIGEARAPAGLITVGSSLLKVALHPAAGWLRESVERVLASPAPWLDVQSLNDPLNFHDSNPAEALGLAGPDRVRTLRIRFRDQLRPESYRRMKTNFYRVHRQFVHGVELPTGYSFHVILCGPYRFSAVADGPGLPPVWLEAAPEAQPC